MGPVRLAGLDIDGTLLNSSGEVTAATLRELHRLHSEGVVLALVTGRRFVSALEVVEQVGLPLSVGVHNGAALREADGSYVYTRALPQESTRMACRLGRSAGAFAWVYRDDTSTGVTRIFCEPPTSAPDGAVMAFAQRYVVANQDVLTVVEDLARGFVGDAVEVMLTADESIGDAVIACVSEGVGDAAQVIKEVSSGICHIEVAHPCVSKALPLRTIAERHGLDPREVLAIGDNFNDIDMLQYAGHAYVMGNARPELLGMGFPAAPSHDEDGLAWVLSQIE